MSTLKKHLVIGKRNQITLPKAFLPGHAHFVAAEKLPNGNIVLVPETTIPSSQAYFWTKRWQAGERQVDREIEEGKLSGPMTAEELIEEMRQLRKKKRTR